MFHISALYGSQFHELAEAIAIDNKAKEVNLNSKCEYFQHSVKRLQLNDHENKDECTYCGRRFKKIEDLQVHETDFHAKQRCETCEYVAIGLKYLSYHGKVKQRSQSRYVINVSISEVCK